MFQVTQRGRYQIMMNVSISRANNGSVPVVGVWNDNTGKWVARIASTYNSDPNDRSDRQIYTLITVVELFPNVNYSFRVANSSSFTVHGYNGGDTGEGPATFVSVKQLK